MVPERKVVLSGNGNFLSGGVVRLTEEDYRTVTVTT